MTSIAEQVKAFLDNDFIIRKCLFRNIISLRALSRHIIETLNLEEKNLDAVMSAIRRYKKEERKKTETELKKLFSKVAVKTRSNIVDICLKKSKKILEQLNKINSIVDIEKGEVIRLIQSEEGIRIIIDEKNIDKLCHLCEICILHQSHVLLLLLWARKKGHWFWSGLPLDN